MRRLECRAETAEAVTDGWEGVRHKVARLSAAALIEAAIPDDTVLPQTWPVCAVLLPHARLRLT